MDRPNPDKKKLKQSDRENLLGELEGVKDLLFDEENGAQQTPVNTAAEKKTKKNAGHQETPEPVEAQKTLFPPIPDEINVPIPEKAPFAGDSAKQDNPFLSSGVKEKLAKAQSQAHKELNQLIAQSGGTADRRKPENWKKAQQRLRAQSASILQEIIEEAMPGIEAELRNRLQLEMDLLLEEMEQQDR